MKISITDFKKQMITEINKALASAKKRPNHLQHLVEDLKVLRRRHKCTHRDYFDEIKEAEESLNAVRQKFNVGNITIQVLNSTFIIENTIEALTAVRKKVRGLRDAKPEKSNKSTAIKKIPYKGRYHIEIISGDLCNTPVPASPRKSGSLKSLPIDGLSDYITDGAYLIRKDAIGNGKYINVDDNDRIIFFKKINDLITDYFKRKNMKQIEEAGRIPNLFASMSAAIFTDGCKIIAFNTTYIDFFHRNVPDFNLIFNMSNPTQGSVIRSGTKKVGILMPFDTITELNNIKIRRNK